MTNAERDALLARIDERTANIEAHLAKINGRVGEIERREMACPIDLPQRVRALEDERERIRGMVAVAKWVGGGGGLAGVIALVLQIVALLERMGVIR